MSRSIALAFFGASVELDESRPRRGSHGSQLPDPVPPEKDIPGVVRHDVNLIGEWNVGGEFWNVSPLFDELGLRVLCSFSGDSRFREVQTMHRAEASMVVCSKAMLHVARKLEEDYSIPWFEGSFYGVKDTSVAFRGFARLLGDADLTARVEALVAREDYKFVMLGTHDAVARAVQAGQVQAGGLSQEIFKKLVEKGAIDGGKLVVIAESAPIPNYPLVMQSSLAPDLKAAIRKAFLELQDKKILETFRAEGFAPTDDRAYDVLRTTAKILDLDLAKLK